MTLPHAAFASLEHRSALARGEALARQLGGCKSASELAKRLADMPADDARCLARAMLEDAEWRKRGASDFIAWCNAKP